VSEAGKSVRIEAKQARVHHSTALHCWVRVSMAGRDHGAELEVCSNSRPFHWQFVINPKQQKKYACPYVYLSMTQVALVFASLRHHYSVPRTEGVAGPRIRYIIHVPR